METNLYQSFLKFSETPYQQEPFDSVKISKKNCVNININDLKTYTLKVPMK